MPVKVTAKSTLPEFANMQIFQVPVEPDLAWDDFFNNLNNVTQFDANIHAVKSSKNVAAGRDRILNTSLLFPRGGFTVNIVSKTRPRFNNRRGRANGPSLISPDSLLSNATTRRAGPPNSITIGQVNAVVRGQRGGRGRGSRGVPLSRAGTTSARGRGRSHVVSVPAAGPGPDSSGPAARGHMRGGRAGFAGGQRGRSNRGGRGRPGSIAGSQASASTFNSTGVAPPTPMADVGSGSNSLPNPIRLPDDLFGSSAAPLPNNRVIYAESIVSEDGDNGHVTNQVPASGSRKDIFLQNAARVPSSDFEGFYRELQNLKTVARESFFRWSRKAPNVANFLQYTLQLE